jgi:hypothetical protein
MPYVAEEVRFNAAIDHCAPRVPRWGIEVYFEKCRRRDLAGRDGFAQGIRARARLGLIARSGAMGQADDPNLLPVTLREVLRMSLMSIGVEL